MRPDRSQKEAAKALSVVLSVIQGSTIHVPSALLAKDGNVLNLTVIAHNPKCTSSAPVQSSLPVHKYSARTFSKNYLRLEENFSDRRLTRWQVLACVLAAALQSTSLLANYSACLLACLTPSSSVSFNAF